VRVCMCVSCCVHFSRLLKRYLNTKGPALEGGGVFLVVTLWLLM